MAIATYSDLQSAVQDYLDDDLSVRIGDLITMAETRIKSDRRIQVPAAISRATISGTLPDGFIRLISVVSRYPVEYTGSEKYAQIEAQGVSGDYIKYVCQEGNSLKVLPAIANFDIAYFGLPPLSDSNPTNWLLSGWPSIYMYSTLLEAVPFLGDDTRLTLFASAYDTAVNQLVASNRARGKMITKSMSYRTGR